MMFDGWTFAISLLCGQLSAGATSLMNWACCKIKVLVNSIGFLNTFFPLDFGEGQWIFNFKSSSNKETYQKGAHGIRDQLSPGDVAPFQS